MPSYATDRKIRILTERIGTDWKLQVGSKSIDAAYTELIGDKRKNLFCKVKPKTKEQLDEMVEGYEFKLMSEFLEQIIGTAYDQYLLHREDSRKSLADQYVS